MAVIFPASASSVFFLTVPDLLMDFDLIAVVAVVMSSEVVVVAVAVVSTVVTAICAVAVVATVVAAVAVVVSTAPVPLPHVANDYLPPVANYHFPLAAHGPLPSEALFFVVVVLI